ncbi:transmembrane protein 242 [Culicoides brevitarsis]|uniref:transmembrane protein 242 n=1 Tax=Culicoides brevitarsis TaxID=469753 RepID=UPI00307C7B26
MSSSPELASNEKKKERIISAGFLFTVAGIAAIAGFGRTLTVAKRKDPKFFDKGVVATREMNESGAMLAMRALAWGSLYAWIGTGCICYGIWKMSGASNFEEFRQVVGDKLPRIKKNDPPQSRTEFEGLNDLMGYLSTWGASKASKQD